MHLDSGPSRVHEGPIKPEDWMTVPLPVPVRTVCGSMSYAPDQQSPGLQFHMIHSARHRRSLGRPAPPPPRGATRGRVVFNPIQVLNAALVFNSKLVCPGVDLIMVLCSRFLDRWNRLCRAVIPVLPAAPPNVPRLDTEDILLRAKRGARRVMRITLAHLQPLQGLFWYNAPVA